MSRSQRLRTVDQLPAVALPPDFALREGQVLAEASKQHGPIFRANIHQGGRRLYLVGPEANRTIMLEEGDSFSHYHGWNRTTEGVEIFGPGLLFMDGPAHRRIRQAILPSFSSPSIDREIPTMNAIIEERLATWRDGSVIDLYAETYQITFELAAVLLIGLKRGEGVGRLFEIFHELTGLNLRNQQEIAFDPRLRSERRKELSGELRAFLRSELKELQLSSGTAALGRLAKKSEISDEQLVDQANTFLFAGHITTSRLSAFLLHRLATERQFWATAAIEQRAADSGVSQIGAASLARMPYLDRILKEGERLFSPVPALPRTVMTDDVAFHGYQIPRDQTLFCSIAGTHMSSDIFREPHRFDPDRFSAPRSEDLAMPLSLVAFAAGPRRCLGIIMARVEIKLILAHILRRFTLEPLGPAIGISQPLLVPLHGLKVRVRRI